MNVILKRVELHVDCGTAEETTLVVLELPGGTQLVCVAVDPGAVHALREAATRAALTEVAVPTPSEKVYWRTAVADPALRQLLELYRVPEELSQTDLDAWLTRIQLPVVRPPEPEVSVTPWDVATQEAPPDMGDDGVRQL